MSALVLFEKAMNAVFQTKAKMATSKMAISAIKFAHICLHRAVQETFLVDGLRTVLVGLGSDFKVTEEMQTGSERADIVVRVRNTNRIVIIA